MQNEDNAGVELYEDNAGVELWEAVNPEKFSKGGRPRAFETPQAMWEKAVEYFIWCKNNPIKEGRYVQIDGKATLKALPKMRAMTLDGLETFMGIGSSCWNNYTKREEFVEVTKEITKVIREQKFTGAASGLLNPNIIARDLGLAEKVDQEVKADTTNVNKNMNINTNIDFESLDEEDRALVEKLLSKHEDDKE